MSVIVRDLQKNKNNITLICKGADSIVEKRLDKSDYNQTFMKLTQHFVNEYAKEGLRTLLVASKQIDQEDYK